jgi:hypothetical protein
MIGEHPVGSGLEEVIVETIRKGRAAAAGPIGNAWRICARFAAILALVLCAWASSARAAPPSGWPASISGDSGFEDLGKVIANEPGFPKAGSDVEKARYVFGRLPDIVRTYGLKPGTGSTLSNVVIEAARVCSTDPEAAESLKGWSGWGNCGEFSYAFSEVLGGAGVTNRVVFGDNDASTGHSSSFAGTDTTLIVVEKDASGRVSRRVFDAFRATFHAPGNIPDASTLARWGDVPLTPKDSLPRDAGHLSWRETVDKSFVKDASTETVMPEAPPKNWPSQTKASAGIQVVAGTWGENCKAPRGNSTGPLAAACNGKASCDYKVDRNVLTDPAYLCRKDYAAEWRCGEDQTVQKAYAAITAGMDGESGNGAIVRLSCGGS